MHRQGPARPLVISLLGHGNVALAVRCYGSLVRWHRGDVEFRLHDDGSLTDEDRALLRDRVPVAEFVERAEADRRMMSDLAAYPALLALRRRNPLGLKLLDAALWSTGREPFVFVDSDILFLRPFAGLFELPEDVDAVFMRDFQDAYSLRSWHLVRHPGLRLPRRVNTGIVVFRREAYDLDRLEWYVGRTGFGFSPGWEEQTGWAILGGGARTRLLARDQFWIPRAEGDLEPARLAATVGLHFVTPSRSLIDRLPATGALEGPAAEPVRVRLEPAPRCRPWHLAQGEAGRVSRRIASRISSGRTSK